MSAAAPVPAAEPAPSAIGRVVGAIVSPGETFASIARRPTWLVPLILWTIVSIGVTTVLLPKIDYEKAIRSALEKRSQTVPEDRIPQIIEQQKKIGTMFGWGFGALGPTVTALFVTVVIWGSFKAFGWDTTFKQGLGVTAHAFLPGVLKGLILLFLITRQEMVDPQALGDLLRSNLGFLVARDSSKALHSLLGSIDVFTFWTLFLFVLGFSAAAKIKRGAAAGVIVALWVVTVVIGVAWNAIF